MQMIDKIVKNHKGSVAERSKALVLGTGLFGGVGSNPTAATFFFLIVKNLHEGIYAEKTSFALPYAIVGSYH